MTKKEYDQYEKKMLLCGVYFMMILEDFGVEMMDALQLFQLACVMPGPYPSFEEAYDTAQHALGFIMNNKHPFLKFDNITNMIYIAKID